MEEKFQLLDLLFPADFMTELRQQNESYNQSVEPVVIGTPAYTCRRFEQDKATWNLFFYPMADTFPRQRRSGEACVGRVFHFSW